MYQEFIIFVLVKSINDIYNVKGENMKDAIEGLIGLIIIIMTISFILGFLNGAFG